MSMLALKLTGYQKNQEAEDLLEKALRTEPDNPHVTRYVAKYLRAQVGDIVSPCDASNTLNVFKTFVMLHGPATG